MPIICKQQFLYMVRFTFSKDHLNPVSYKAGQRANQGPIKTQLWLIWRHRFKNSGTGDLLRLHNLFEMMEEGNETGFYCVFRF